MGLRNYAGGAVVTTVTGTLAASGPLSIVIADATGWPTTNFSIKVSRGTVREEKMFVLSRTGTTLTVEGSGRAYDDTTAVAHSDGDEIFHCDTAVDAEEANAHVNDTTLHLGTGTIDDAAMLASGVVTEAKIATGAVTEAKIGALAVVEAKIGALAVTAAKIAADAVTTAKILDLNVTTGKIAELAVTAGKIAADAVTTAKILDANVTEAKLGTDIKRLEIGDIYERPIGDIPAWALELNGQAVSRTTYATLFALWGETFGVGDGTTTFNVMDRSGVVAVGKDTGDTAFDTIGETGGVAEVTLTAAQSGLPAHTHTTSGTTSTDGSHAHDIDAASGSGGDVGITVAADTGDSGTGGYIVAAGSHNHTTSGTAAANTAAAASSAHTNLQPYIVTRFLVRAL